MKRKVKIDVEKKNSYVADFETTCSEYDRAYGHSRVWLYDICSFIGLNHFTGYSIEDFFKSCQALAPCYIYFHNLRFDGNFIISWLLKHDFKCVECNTRHKLRKHEFSTLITDMGIFEQLPNELSMGRALLEKGALEVQDHGVRYQIRLNGIKIRGWMIKDEFVTKIRELPTTVPSSPPA